MKKIKSVKDITKAQVMGSSLSTTEKMHFLETIKIVKDAHKKHASLEKKHSKLLAELKNYR